MLFVPPYPNIVPSDGFIDNLITLLSDEEYQAGALRWANGGEPLEPYALVSESAVWREEGGATPALLVKDVSTESREGAGGLFLLRSHRFSVYQCLSLEDDHEALMREAYRRATAVEMMIRGAEGSGFDLFGGTGMGADGMSVRLSYGDTAPGKASYFRFPSVDVEIPALEA